MCDPTQETSPLRAFVSQCVLVTYCYISKYLKVNSWKQQILMILQSFWGHESKSGLAGWLWDRSSNEVSGERLAGVQASSRLDLSLTSSFMWWWDASLSSPQPAVGPTSSAAALATGPSQQGGWLPPQWAIPERVNEIEAWVPSCDLESEIAFHHFSLAVLHSKKHVTRYTPH